MVVALVVLAVVLLMALTAGLQWAEGVAYTATFGAGVWVSADV